jgi:hypothetical protein
MLTLLINLFYLAVFCVSSLLIFNLVLRKNKLLLKTISIFLVLHAALISVILIEQHRFKIDLSGSIFMNDGESYSGNGWQISTALTNAIPGLSAVSQMRGIHIVDRCLGLKGYYDEYIIKNVMPPAGDYEVGFISYLYAMVYATYGFKPVLINFINAMLHLFTAILIYRSVSIIFNKKAAYIATLFFLLNPVAFYYASTKLQESLFIFIVYLSIYCFLMAIRNKSWGHTLLLSFLLYLIYALLKRQYFAPLMLTFALTSGIVFFKNNKKLFFAVLIIVFSILAGMRIDVFKKAENFKISALNYSLGHQQGFYNSGGSTYRLALADKKAKDYTLMDCASYILSGWYHMLSEPILSENLSFKLILFYPFKIIFLVLCLLALPGILMAVRYGHTDAIVFICFLAVVGSSIAVSSGNIGSMLRHRNLIVPVVFIFSSFYISLKERL